MYTGMHSVIFSLVQAVVLLVVSFFILLAAHKTDSKNIKTFGYVIAFLLWVSAALVFGKGIFEHHSMCHRMHLMGGKMERPMLHGEVPQEAGQVTPIK
jgi:hypothetical protein